MKRLFLAAFAVGLIGCAQQPAPPPGPAVTGGYTYDRYARSADAWGHSNPVYKNWTTEQLQKRRLDLYAQVPFTRNRNEVQTAELKEFWPSSRRHIASGSRVESLF